MAIKVAIMGAGGKMGCRITDNMLKHPEKYEMAYVEVSVAGIDTGNDRRDKDLRKRGFLDVQNHPVVRVAVTDVTPTSDGWAAEALVHARGRSAPVALTVQPADDGEEGPVVRVTGRLDRAPLGIRAPTFIVGRFVDLDVTLALRR